MAKAQGIIGNFKGKIGNTVGYQLTSSNNKQTQGIRIYQPNVKNPKTSAQAEQRAKLAPINATYRLLKMIIDRGNESLPYGNKARLAWLKQAFKAEEMPWFEKGTIPTAPVGCQLTKGSLSSLNYICEGEILKIDVPGLTQETDITTVGKLSTALLAGIPALKEGDQLTIVAIYPGYNGCLAEVNSIVLNSTSSETQNSFITWEGQVHREYDYELIGYAVIVSREGASGEHLRSNESLVIPDGDLQAAPYDAASKTAAIESYMASGAANTDWAEESIQ